MNKLSALLIAILSLLPGCATETELQTTVPATTVGNPIGPNDEVLLQIAQRLPEFGGMFFDDAGNLNVLLAEDVENMSATERRSRAQDVESALSAVLGDDFLRRDPRRASALMQTEDSQERANVPCSAHGSDGVSFGLG